MIINRENIKKYSLIPWNYNMDEAMNFVDLTEITWVKPVLGSELYDEIQQQVKDDDLSDENSTLLVEAIWPYEGMALMHEFLPYAYAHISEIGITVGHSDNSDSVDLKQVTYLASHIRSQVETFKRNAIRFLQEHAESFPLWEPDEDFCHCKKPTSCCGTPELKNPEPMRIIYTTPKKNLDIR